MTQSISTDFWVYYLIKIAIKSWPPFIKSIKSLLANTMSTNIDTVCSAIAKIVNNEDDDDVERLLSAVLEIKLHRMYRKMRADYSPEEYERGFRYVASHSLISYPLKLIDRVWAATGITAEQGF